MELSQVSRLTEEMSFKSRPESGLQRWQSAHQQATYIEFKLNKTDSEQNISVIILTPRFIIGWTSGS